MTTAPAAPRTLYGPDGQALVQPAKPSVEEWRPVRAKGNAVVWERPRPAAASEQIEGARSEAEKVLADARNEAERITEEARTIRETARAEAARKEDNSKRLDLWMARAVIAGAVGLTASGEYSLARLAHFPSEVAWLLPFVIDIYVIQAFRRHRDILQAIALTIAANVVYHLAAAGMFGVTTDAQGRHHATWWLIALVASIASVILWRMHVITVPQSGRRKAGTAPDSKPVPGHAEPSVPASPAHPVPAGDETTVPVPDSKPVPALRPVPDSTPVPARKPASTGRTNKRTATRKASTSKTGTASFDGHVRLAREWLAADPSLSGAEIGKRLGTGDSYGRRVKRAATN
ncbi:DivIVA domain-containing protein [Streptomyces sp. AHA2]|uniref:DivIVA domain-containing protein n=1 Tax=Streptomyces sp. AHA2 TaxID=3064526 RepID=UPI002FE10CCF